MAVRLGLSEKEATRYYTEYWRLKRLNELHSIYKEIKGDLSLILKLYRLLKREGIRTKDLVILKKVLYQFEQRTHSENAYKFSERATLAAGWWFYDVFFKRDFVQKIFQLLLPPNYSYKNKKSATLKIVDTFQDQIKKDVCSGAKYIDNQKP